MKDISILILISLILFLMLISYMQERFNLARKDCLKKVIDFFKPKTTTMIDMDLINQLFKVQSEFNELDKDLTEYGIEYMNGVVPFIRISPFIFKDDSKKSLLIRSLSQTIIRYYSILNISGRYYIELVPKSDATYCIKIYIAITPSEIKELNRYTSSQQQYEVNKAVEKNKPLIDDELEEQIREVNNDDSNG